MTFAAFETSIDQGEPILLFDFSIGVLHFRYTTADRNITWATNVYTSAPISRAAIKQGSEIKQQTLKVTGPRDLSVAALYATEAPSAAVALTITALHHDDPDAQGVADWIGRVLSAKWTGSNVELACEPVYTSVQTMGLRRRFQISCPHVLYGVQCTVAPSPYATPGTVTALSGFAISAAPWGTPPGAGLSFVGGFVTWDSGNGYLERRTIQSVSGDALTIDNIGPGLAIGTVVTAYPGCDRSMTNCQAFGNLLNYGGQPYIPTINPMNGNPVY